MFDWPRSNLHKDRGKSVDLSTKERTVEPPTSLLELGKGLLKGNPDLGRFVIDDIARIRNVFEGVGPRDENGRALPGHPKSLDAKRRT